MGLGTALVTQAATTGAGILANEVFNEEPEVPDLSAEAQSEFVERRRDLADILDRRRKEMEASLAASGRTGSAGASARRKLAGEFAESQADLASKEAQAVANAQNREDRLEFKQDQATRQNRAQGIANLVRGTGRALGAQAMTEEGLSGLFGESAPSGEDLGGGGGDATLLDAPTGGGFDATSFMGQRYGVMG